MNNNTKILVVDDDAGILGLLKSFLNEQHIYVDVAESAVKAEAMLSSKQYDLMVLDLMLPGEDGLSFCRRLRASSSIPIIMLTAMGDETDRIVGLEIGADDYLSKPFNPRELLARIRAVLRRPKVGQAVFGNHCYQFGCWVLNPLKRELRTIDQVLMTLTSGEFDLLLCFVTHPQISLNRDQILDLTKGKLAGPFDRSIDVQLSRLRQKIEIDAKHPTLIKTIRNCGYIFSVEVELISCA